MISVFVATGISLLREGFLRIFTDERGVHVVATVAEGGALLRSCGGDGPDVVLLDVELPGLSAAAVMRRLEQRGCTSAVILFGRLTPENVAVLRQLPFHGILDISDDREEYVRAVHAVHHGQRFVSASVEKRLRGPQQAQAASETRIEDLLTSTELQIFRALAQNQTSQEIARGMYISYRTVQKHRTNMARKLKLSGSNALLAFALRYADGNR